MQRLSARSVAIAKYSDVRILSALAETGLFGSVLAHPVERHRAFVGAQLAHVRRFVDIGDAHNLIGPFRIGDDGDAPHQGSVVHPEPGAHGARAWRPSLQILPIQHEMLDMLPSNGIGLGETSIEIVPP